MISRYCGATGMPSGYSYALCDYLLIEEGEQKLGGTVGCPGLSDRVGLQQPTLGLDKILYGLTTPRE